MTVHDHTTYTNEGITQETLDTLGVSGKEMVVACDQNDTTPAVVDHFNEHYSDEHTPVKSAGDLPKFVFNEWREWVDGHEEEVLFEILDEREEEYIFDVDRSLNGTAFYTITTIHDTY